jgi:hypothetical protein
MTSYVQVSVNELVPGEIYIGVKPNGQQSKGRFTQIIQDNYVEIKEFGGHTEWFPINGSRFLKRGIPPAALPAIVAAAPAAGGKRRKTRKTRKAKKTRRHGRK